VSRAIQMVPLDHSYVTTIYVTIADYRTVVKVVKQRKTIYLVVPAEAEPEPEECCICYDEIDGKKNKAVTKCGHLFCLTCLLTQFQNKNECPLCRRELLENSPNSFETIRIPISRTDNIFNRILSGDLNSSRGFFMTMVGHIWHDHCRTVVEALTRRYENLVIQLPGRALRDRPERPVGRRCGICRQEGHDRRRCPNRG
jgi:hypothetical protein